VLLQKQDETFFSQETLTEAVKFVFSWVILLAIGVIVSGKLLSQRLKLRTETGQLFRIPIKGVLTVQATGAEVVLGFTFYLLAVLLLGSTYGSSLQPWVKSHYGIDPGQFNAVGFMSSLLSVAVSFVVYLFSIIPVTVFGRSAVMRHDSILSKITEEKTGLKPEDLPEVKA